MPTELVIILTGVALGFAYSVVPGAVLVPDYFVPASCSAPPGVRLSTFRMYPLDDLPA